MLPCMNINQQKNPPVSEQSTPHIWQPWVRVPVSRHYQDIGGAVCSLQAFLWWCHLLAGLLVFPLTGMVCVGSDGKSQEPTSKNRAKSQSGADCSACWFILHSTAPNLNIAFNLFNKMDIWVQTDLGRSRLAVIPVGEVLAQLPPLSGFKVGCHIKGDETKGDYRSVREL